MKDMILRHKKAIEKDQTSIDHYRDWQCLSKPVHTSLSVIIQYDAIDYIEGSCGKHKSFTPFTIRMKSGKFLCRPTSIHAYRDEITERVTRQDGPILIGTLSDRSRHLKFRGVVFWINDKNVIMRVPSNEWHIADELVEAGFATRTHYQHLWGHVEYVLLDSAIHTDAASQ